MFTKSFVLALGMSLAFVAGCGRPSDCQPAVAVNSMTCPSTVFIDATKSDPVCLTSSGVPVCRGADAICYRCNGASFTDGCLIKNEHQTIECVHTCSNC